MVEQSWNSGRLGRWIKIVLCAAAVLSIAAFVTAMYRGAFYFPLLIDDAFTATVAKNWALGDGFSSSYGKLRPFDPEITTGPGLVAPLALAIKLFGQETWVARVAPLTLNLGLLAVLLWRLRSWLPLQSWLWLALILPLCFSRISAHMWFTPLGDVTAFLYLALAAVFANDALESRRRSLAWVCGLFIGLAILTKTVALTAIAGLLVLPGIWAVLQRKSAVGYFLLNAIPAVFLVLLPWEIYTQWSLHREPVSWQIARELEAQHIFLATGSGIVQVVDAWDRNQLLPYLMSSIGANGGHRIANFSSILHWRWVLYSVLAAGILIGVYSTVSFGKEMSRKQIALLLPALGYLMWYFCFSWSPFNQHFFIGFMLLLLAVSLVLVRHWLPALAVTVYLLASVYSHGSGGFEKIAGLTQGKDSAVKQDWQETWAKNPELLFGDIYWPVSGKHMMSESVDNLISEIQSKWPNEQLAGCGWTLVYEIEYRLSGNNRLVDCRYLIGTVAQLPIPETVNRQEDAQASQFRRLEEFIKEKDHWWPTGTSKVMPQWTGSTEFLLVLGFIDRSIHTTLANRLAPFCSEPLYDDGVHTVVRCRQADLEAYVAAEGGIDFYPPQWKEALSIYKTEVVAQSAR